MPEEKNAVIQLLEGLLESSGDCNLVYKGRCYSFSDSECPVNAGVAWVRGQLSEVQKAAKVHAQGA